MQVDSRGAVRLHYALPSAVRALDLGPSLGAYRLDQWRLATRGLVIEAREGRDVLARADNRPFRAAEIDVGIAPVDAPRTYDALTRLGERGVLVYTGHFQPWRNGRRAPTRFSFFGPSGAVATAFGEVESAFWNWKSRLDHPAFVFVGPVAPRRAGGVSMVIDPAAPDWVAEAVEETAVRVADGLEQRFGWALDVTPDLFLSFTPGFDGQASFAGDALPGQFRIALEGRAWDRRSEMGRDILIAGLAHEAAHLWQTAARPSPAGAADWIHEGGANAIAAQLLVELGYWTGERAFSRFAEARRECLDLMKGRSLEAAEAASAGAASYACGHVLNELAAAAHPDGAIGFWNDLILEARRIGGYDEALFLRLTANLHGEAFAADMARFLRTHDRRPDRSMAALEARLAHAPWRAPREFATRDAGGLAAPAVD